MTTLIFKYLDRFFSLVVYAVMAATAYLAYVSNITYAWDLSYAYALLLATIHSFKMALIYAVLLSLGNLTMGLLMASEPKMPQVHKVLYVFNLTGRMLSIKKFLSLHIFKPITMFLSYSSVYFDYFTWTYCYRVKESSNELVVFEEYGKSMFSQLLFIIRKNHFFFIIYFVDLVSYIMDDDVIVRLVNEKLNVNSFVLDLFNKKTGLSSHEMGRLNIANVISSSVIFAFLYTSIRLRNIYKKHNNIDE